MENSLRCDYIINRHKNIGVDEWPPDQPETVVNVALIHYKGSRTEQEFIEISKRHKEGTQAIDELAYHSRVTKDITKLFQTDDTCLTEAKTKLPNFILIEGAPGIGKTRLAKEIAYRWAEKELLSDVKILFLMFLRDPELQAITTLEQLIKYLSGISLDENSMKQIMNLKVAIVMDGFDEYPKELRQRSFIVSIINCRVFRNCIIVLTSRPTATISLHSRVDQRIEILGFAHKERGKYISESLNSPEKIKQLQDYLKYHPIINGLIYVPLHLAILLYLFKHGSKLPETLTEMNELFIVHTIYRSLAKNKLNVDNSAMKSIKDLPKNISDIVNRLSKLAFKGLKDNQLVFSNAEITEFCPENENGIPGAFNGFGLLQVVQHLPGEMSAGTTASFNYLHFTMQEYLAAFHVFNAIPHDQQLSLMNETFWDSTYSFMWIMYVGISGVTSRTFVQFLYNEAQPEVNVMKLTLSTDIKSDKLKCLYLFQCFMEAKSEEVPEEVSSIFHNDEINFYGVQLLPYHISSLVLYISKYSMPLQTLNLRNCHIGDIGMSILEHFFIANPEKGSNMKHVDLFGNNSVLLWNVYCAIFGQQNLKELNWSSLGEVNIDEIVTVMENNMIVQSLNLSDNHFKNDDAKKLAKILSNNKVLQKFDFSSNDISAVGATSISESLQYNFKLHSLKISWSNNFFIDTDYSTISFVQKSLNDEDVHIVANILCSSKTTTKLDLSQNRISNNGVESLRKCIKNNKSIVELNISRNRISNNGLRTIAISLQGNHTLQKLDISYNNISNDGAIAIAECLKNNNTLQVLNMSYNLVSSGFVNIGKALQENTALQVIDISFNKITGDGIHAVADYFKKGINLQKFIISWNNICDCLVIDFMDLSWDMCNMKFGNTGAILMSAMLCFSTKIQKLDISCNNVSDDGAIAISQCLKINNTLQELNMSGNLVSDNGVVNLVKALQENIGLQVMDVSFNVISDDGVCVVSDYFRKGIKLRKFIISWNNICQVFDFTVQSCFMCGIKIGDTGAILIAAILYRNTNIQKLDISHNNISDDGATAIAECLKHNNTLQELNMSHNVVSDNGIVNISKALQENMALQIIDISSNEISDDGVCAVGNYLSKGIKLHNFTISWNGIYLFLDFMVQSCVISRKKFGDSGATLISAVLYSNTNIQKLDISHNNISDDGAIAISECLKHNCTLQELNMSHNVVTDNGIVNILKSLQENKALQTIDISFNAISEDGFCAFNDCLRKTTKLQKFTISWNDINLVLDFKVQSCFMHKMKLGNTGAFLISAVLFSNINMQKLDISHNGISDDGAIAISESLKNNSTLQELNISHNVVSNDGIVNISKALQENTELQILDISINEISDDGAIAISEYLRNNNTLQELNMSHNIVSNKGIVNVSEALQENKTLRILDISCNKISDDGAVAISECLKSNNTLQKLNISYNEVSNNGIINISKALHKNTALVMLNMSYDEISDDGMIAISECFKNNNTLQEFNMSDNKLYDKTFINIVKFPKINTTIQLFNILNNNISSNQAKKSLKNNSASQTLGILNGDIINVNNTACC